MNYKRFVKSFFTVLILSTAFIATVNFIVDPLWTFKTTQNIDIKQKDFNERIQKTNYLAFKDNNFNAVLLGNSRVTYIDQNDFDLGFKIYNYAVNAMPLSEYEAVIDNFIKLTNNEPELIILGVEPFNLGENNQEVLKEAFLNTTDISYRFKRLVSMDTFWFSCKNLYLTFKLNSGKIDRKQRYYNKTLEKGTKLQNNVSNKNFIEIDSVSKVDFLNEKSFDIYKKLKQKYSNSEFIIFTMPVHSTVFNQWIKDEKFIKDYSVWLKGLVATFGKVTHFLYDSSVSESYYNFFDPFHFYPNVGKKIAQKVSYGDNFSKNDTFGIILTKNNIDKYLEQFNKGKH